MGKLKKEIKVNYPIKKVLRILSMNPKYPSEIREDENGELVFYHNFAGIKTDCIIKDQVSIDFFKAQYELRQMKLQEERKEIYKQMMSDNLLRGRNIPYYYIHSFVCKSILYQEMSSHLYRHMTPRYSFVHM